MLGVIILLLARISILLILLLRLIVACLGLTKCVLRLLKTGLRLLVLLAELRLVYSHVEGLGAILRLWMIGMDLLMTAAYVMLIIMLRVRRWRLKSLLATLIQVWRWLYRGAGIECSSVRCSGIILLKNQLHAYSIELVRFVGVLLGLTGPLVSPGFVAASMVFVGLDDDY